MCANAEQDVSDAVRIDVATGKRLPSATIGTNRYRLKRHRGRVADGDLHLRAVRPEHIDGARTVRIPSGEVAHVAHAIAGPTVGHVATAYYAGSIHLPV